MPKVYLNEKDRLCNRLSTWIYGQLKANNQPQKVLADKMDVTQQALSYKLRVNSFSYRDFLAVVDTFKPDTDELEWILGVKR